MTVRVQEVSRMVFLGWLKGKEQKVRGGGTQEKELHGKCGRAEWMGGGGQGRGRVCSPQLSLERCGLEACLRIRD